ncbi:MAG TPA: hypothetical protein VII74_00760, partial [Chthoniobacterales bacterium]
MNGTDHLTSKERGAYWEHTLAPQTLLEVSDHLQKCAQCREELRRERPTTVNPADAVSYEDLVAGMEEDLDPLHRHELAERLTNSPTAAAELADLLQFRDEMNELPAQDYAAVTSTFSRSRQWINRGFAIAAGFALGCGILWLTSTVHRAVGLSLVDQGRTFTVKSNGEINGLGPIPAHLQQAARDAVLLDKVDRPPFWSELQGAKETLAGPPAPANPFRVVAPVGSVVESERPVFRWNKDPGATSYRVNLLRRTTGEVTSSPLLAAGTTSWSPNESLSPNEIYEWEVEASRNGEMLAKAPSPPEPEARFRVLDTATRNSLKALRAKSGGSHLLMGLAYAHAGMRADAERE